MASVLMLIVLTFLTRLCIVEGGNCQEDLKRAREGCMGEDCYLPNCDGNSYAPYGCRESWCFCQTSTGKVAGTYAFLIEEQSDCQCARDEAAGIAKVPCKRDGSYAGNCLEELEKVTRNSSSQQASRFIPNCNGTSFGPYGCQGSRCVCQTSTGEKIWLYEFNSGEITNCQCARDEVEKISTGPCKPNGSYGGNCQEDLKRARERCLGEDCNLPNCDGNSYAPYGCRENWCFCQTSTGEVAGTYAFDIEEQSDCRCARDEAAGIAKAPCKRDGSYAGNCLEELEKATRNSSSQHVSRFIPNCNGTSFGPYGCRGNRCVCQTSTGEKIWLYEFNSGEITNCQCARDEVENISTGPCKHNGSYA